MKNRMNRLLNRKRTLNIVLICLILFYGCDSNPPYVEIVYPVNLQEMNGVDVIVVDAYDEGKVVEVQFFIDGDSLWTDYNEPWEFIWNVAYWADDDFHVLSAKAIDYSGNIGEVFPEDRVNVKVPSSVQVSPHLLTPVLTDTIRDTNTPLFSWLSIPNAVSYEIEMGKFGDYSDFEEIYDMIVDSTGIIYSQVDDIENLVSFGNAATIQIPNDTSLTIDYPITDSTAGFFWHVRGENDAGNFSDWSDTWIFKITGPEGPYPNYPALDTLRSKPAFSWYNNQYLATQYLLVLGGVDPLENENYNGLGYFDEITFVDTIIKGTDVYQEYLPDEEITIESGKHWWKMKSMNDVGIWGEWSLVKYFYISGPIRPTLSNPENGEIITGTNLPDFDWQDSENSIEYQLVIDNNEDFSSPKVDIIIPESFYFLSDLSPEDSLYTGVSFWKTRAKNDVGLWGEWSETWNFNIAGPIHPELLYPTTNKFLTDRDEIWFNWRLAENGVLYQLQVDNNLDFSSPEIDTVIVDSTYSYNGTLNTGRNYWRARSRNNIDLWGEWSPENSFRFYIYPEIPVLTAPESGSTFTSQPVFYWEDLPGVTNFILQISSNLNFDSTSIILEEYPFTTGYSTETYLDTIDNDFFWRVLSRNSADTTYLESDWSEIRYFIGEASSPPALINPEFGEVLIDQPNFAWSSVVNGDNYQILVSSDESFESTIDINMVIGGTGLTSDVALIAGDNYWKVRTQNFLGIWSDYSEISMFIVGGPLPLALLDPENNSTIFSQPTLTWMPMSGAIEYEVLIDDSLSFNSPELDTIINSNEIHSSAPLTEGTNFWKVRGKSDLDIWGGFTDTWQFSLIGPNGPELQEPVNGFPVYTTLTPYFMWDSLSTAIKYQIEISMDEDFSDIEYSDSTILTPNTTLITELTEGIHYWRIRGQNELGMWGTWSPTDYFDITGPPGPELAVPINSATITEDATPVFSWFGEPYAVNYLIQIDDNEDFTSIILEAVTDTLAFEPIEPITDIPAEFYWRVYSQNEFGFWGSASESREFSISGPAYPNIDSFLPNIFDLIRHTNQPVFSWESVDIAEGYHIQVDDTDNSFSNLVTDNDEIPSNTYTVEIPLEQGMFYWRLRVRNIDFIWGEWSPGLWFTVTGTEPPELLYPLGDTLTYLPEFSWEYTDTIPVQQYEIQVDNNPVDENDEFPSPEISIILNGDVSTYAAVDTLKNGNNYWRVRSMNEVGYWGEWSEEPGSFYMKGPNPPELILPVEGDTIRHLPEFSWNTVGEAVDYQLEVNDDSDFIGDSVEIRIITPELNYFSLYGDSLAGGQNYWRMRSRSIIGLWGEWSEVNSFNLAGPLPPALNAPAHEDTLRTQPTFSWSTPEYAENYFIEVDNTSEFSSPEIENETNLNFYTSEVSLIEGTNYWRVMAQNDAGIWGDWSAINQLTITGPLSPSLLTPENNSRIYDTDYPEFTWLEQEYSVDYQIQILKDSTILQENIIEGVSYTALDSLESGYNQWRVRGRNNLGIWGDWSESWNLWIPYDLIMEFVEIPSGNFTWGEDDEIVDLNYDYSISKYQITNEQYVQFLNEAYQDGDLNVNESAGFVSGECEVETNNITTKILFTLDGDISTFNLATITFSDNIFYIIPGPNDLDYNNHPVVFVSWCGAQAFVSHYNLSVPTEQEWEKAARGDTGFDYPWGDEITNTNANYLASGDPWDNGTTPVGFYNGQNYDGFQTEDSPSPFGVYDMAGNVNDWTRDILENDVRIYKGGSYFNLNSAIKSYTKAEYTGVGGTTEKIGFRVVFIPD